MTIKEKLKELGLYLDGSICYSDTDDPTSYSDLNYREFGPRDGEIEVIIPSLMSWSDYGGSTVCIANFRVFVDEHGEKPGVHQLYGCYRSRGVALTVEALDDEDIVESLKSLEDYPILSDDELREVERDAEQEARDSWAVSDFIHELTRLGVDEDWLDRQDSAELFLEAEKYGWEDGIYWVNEQGPDMHIDVDALARLWYVNTEREFATTGVEHATGEVEVAE